MSRKENKFSISDKLKHLMMIKGVSSVTSLSTSIGVSQQTIYKIYAGLTKKPRQELLEKLSNFFDVPVGYFINKSIGEFHCTKVPVYKLSATSLSETNEMLPTNNKQVFKVALIETKEFFPEVNYGSYLYLSDFTDQNISEGKYVLHDMNNICLISYLINREGEWFLKDIKRVSNDAIRLTNDIKEKMIGLIEEIHIKNPTKNILG